jgi:hypothetical protein
MMELEPKVIFYKRSSISSIIERFLFLQNIWEGDDYMSHTAWHKRADRWAWIGTRIVNWSVLAGLVLWIPDPWVPNHLQGIGQIPINLGFLAASLMGIPSVLVWCIDLIKSRKRHVARWIPFIGPLFVFVGFELLAHGLSCIVFPFMCEYLPEHGGWNIAGKWHLLSHSLFGLIPLFVYRLVLWKWHPYLILKKFREWE